MNKNRRVYVDGETYRRIQEKASEENLSVDEYVDKLLNKYLNGRD
jgi:hypothetical protein